VSGTLLASALFNEDLVLSSLRSGTPLMLAALGGLIAWRAGVINIGLEGFMLVGALGATLGTVWTGQVAVGILLGVVAAAAAGGLLGLAIVVRGADQIVTGIAFNIAALGLTSYLAAVVSTHLGLNALSTPLVRNVSIPYLRDIPWVGNIVFDQSPFTYGAVALALALVYVLYNTGLGLAIRAAGEHARAADTAGLPVLAIRFWCFVASAVCAGLGGAFLSVGYLATFVDNLTAGQGYIALAIIILGQWRPLGTLLAALMFGFAQALQIRWQVVHIPFPVQVVLALPYLLTLVVVVTVGRAKGPAEEGRPYFRSE